MFTRPTRPPVDVNMGLVELRPCVIRHMEWTCLDIDVGLTFTVRYVSLLELLFLLLLCELCSCSCDPRLIVIFDSQFGTLSFLFFSCGQSHRDLPQFLRDDFGFA